MLRVVEDRRVDVGVATSLGVVKPGELVPRGLHMYSRISVLRVVLPPRKSSEPRSTGRNDPFPESSDFITKYETINYLVYLYATRIGKREKSRSVGDGSFLTIGKWRTDAGKIITQGKRREWRDSMPDGKLKKGKKRTSVPPRCQRTKLPGI